MAFMAAIAPILSVVGTVVSAVGQIQAGRSQQAAMNYEAAAEKQSAGMAEAAGSARAAESSRQMSLAEESSTANAAGSGVNPGFGSPLKNVGNIAKWGTFNTLMDVYNGKAEATGRLAQANADIFSGQQDVNASYWNAGSTVVGGANTFLQNYGTGPTGSSVNPVVGSSGPTNAFGRTAALGAQGYA